MTPLLKVALLSSACTMAFAFHPVRVRNDSARPWRLIGPEVAAGLTLTDDQGIVTDHQAGETVDRELPAGEGLILELTREEVFINQPFYLFDEFNVALGLPSFHYAVFDFTGLLDEVGSHVSISAGSAEAAVVLEAAADDLSISIPVDAVPVAAPAVAAAEQEPPAPGPPAGV